MKFYVIDTTIPNQQEKWFSSYPEIIKYLEQMSVRAFGQTRKQRMTLLEEIGHGYDDSDSVTFVRSMAEKFNMGVLRDGLKVDQKMRCDVPSVALFQKDEFGS